MGKKVKTVYVQLYFRNVFWDEFTVTNEHITNSGKQPTDHFTECRIPWDTAGVSAHNTHSLLNAQETRLTKVIQYNSNESTNTACTEGYIKHPSCVRMNLYLMSSIFNAIIKSADFFNNINTNCSKQLIPKQNIYNMHIHLEWPSYHTIDKVWGEKLEKLLLERRELDHAMSWLSTLGGAFSALGNDFQHCARMAGRISMKQIHLALQLGDPLTLARCKLYAALSLLQQDRFKLAKFIILQQYSFAITSPVIDTRLVRMCHGIWAKYKYEKNEYARKHSFLVE